MLASPRLVEKIFTAVADGNLDQVESLLDRHPQLIDSRHEGRSLLHQLAQKDHFSHHDESIFELLIIRGACINDRDDVTGQTALHLAVHKHHEKLIRLLINNGADPEVNDHRCQTPISLASEDIPSIAKFLQTFCF